MDGEFIDTNVVVTVDPAPETVIAHVAPDGTETAEVAPSTKGVFLELIRRPEVQDRIYNANTVGEANRVSVKEEERVPPVEVWHTIRQQITQAYGEIDQLSKALQYVQHDRVISATHVDNTETRNVETVYRDLLVRSVSKQNHLNEASQALGEHIKRLSGVVEKQRAFTSALIDLRSRWRLRSMANVKNVPAVVAVDVRLSPTTRRSLLKVNTDVHLLATHDGSVQASAAALAQSLSEQFPCMTLSHDQIYAAGPGDVERLLVRVQRALFAVEVFVLITRDTQTGLVTRAPGLGNNEYTVLTIDDAAIEISFLSRDQRDPPTVVRIALDRDQALSRGDLMITGVDATTQRTLNLYFQQRLREWHVDAQAGWPPSNILADAVHLLLHRRTVSSAERTVHALVKYAWREWRTRVHARWEPVSSGGVTTCTLSNDGKEYYITVSGASILLPPLTRYRLDYSSILDSELMTRLLYKLCRWKLWGITAAARTLGMMITRDELSLYVSTGPSVIPQRALSLLASVDSDAACISLDYSMRTEDGQYVCGQGGPTMAAWKDVDGESDLEKLTQLLLEPSN